MTSELLLALSLPVAAAAGWFGARQWQQERIFSHHKARFPSLFLGLNYLVNDQTDRAIEVFLNIDEAAEEAVDVRIALGILFRRRGDAARAIQIHQQILDLPSLTLEQNGRAVLALAEDFLRAGVLDRAETLALELVNRNVHVADALKLLVDISQQTREWDKALAHMEHLGLLGEPSWRPLMAQFYCEKAILALAVDAFGSAKQSVLLALAMDPACARAVILKGDIAVMENDPARAINDYHELESLDFENYIDCLDKLKQCYEACGKTEAFDVLLESLAGRTHHSKPALMLADSVARRFGRGQAYTALAGVMAKQPTLGAAERLLDLATATDKDLSHANSSLLLNLLRSLLRQKVRYQCIHCGFAGQLLHWQCRGCKRWGGVRLLMGYES